MSKRALGRGIDALLSTETDDSSSVTSIPIEAIKIGSHQPRKNFQADALEELARSIRSKGVLQPILVQAAGTDEYTVVAGERRFRAAKIAGLTEIPVLIRSFSELEKTEIALIENLQREDLSPVEEAQGYKTLIDAGSLTQEQVAQRVGKSRATVANSLRLLKLNADVLEALDKGRITAGHARALLAVQDEAARNRLFRRVLEQELSVREVEQEAARSQDQGGTKDKAERSKEPAKSPELRSLEQNLVERLGTKVSIRGSESRGKIEISYYSMEDLERILSLIADGGE
jgi:ParB family chromosome partitioning protein